jgi:hypothetical protein
LTTASSQRQRSVFLIDLAATFAQQKDPKKACNIAEEALAIIEQTKSKLVLQRMLALRQELEQWNDTQDVKNLHRRIETIRHTMK